LSPARAEKGCLKQINVVRSKGVVAGCLFKLCRREKRDGDWMISMNYLHVVRCALE
jgi:hypothetical protein